MSDIHKAKFHLQQIARSEIRQGKARNGRFYSRFHAAILAGITTKETLSEMVGCDPAHLPTTIDSLKSNKLTGLAQKVLDSCPS